MKTIIVGYADAAGVGPTKIVCGPDVPAAEQNKIMDAAESLDEFPDGIKCVQQIAIGDAPIRAAQWISPEVAEFKRDGRQRVLDLEKQARAKVAEQNRGLENMRFANQIFNDCAAKRNQAIGDVAAQNNLLKSTGLSDKDKSSILEKVKKLQPKADEAIALFNVVLEARKVVLNPESKPEAVTQALATLKNPALPK
jgi:hypothetical protein